MGYFCKKILWVKKKTFLAIWRKERKEVTMTCPKNMMLKNHGIIKIKYDA